MNELWCKTIGYEWWWWYVGWIFLNSFEIYTYIWFAFGVYRIYDLQPKSFEHLKKRIQENKTFKWYGKKMHVSWYRRIMRALRRRLVKWKNVMLTHRSCPVIRGIVKLRRKYKCFNRLGFVFDLPSGSLKESWGLSGSKAAPIPPGKLGGSSGLGPNPNGAKGPGWPVR